MIDGSGHANQNRRDRFSTWSIVLIILVVVIQLIQNDGEALVKRLAKHHREPTAETVSTDSFQQLIEIDTDVKVAYAISLVPKGTLSGSLYTNGKLSSFHSRLQDALDQSVSGLRSSPDSIYFARRVMLLRELLEKSPFAAIPKKGKRAGLTSPMAAYDHAAAEDPMIAPQLLQEKAFWQTNLSENSIPAGELQARLVQLNQIPTLLFYSLIARQDLCLKAGAFAEARHINHLLQYRSAYSLLGLLGVELLTIGLFGIGIVSIIGIGMTLSTHSAGDTATASQAVQSPRLFERLITPQPNLIASEDRKLRAGDLLDCFAIYLVTLTGFGTLLSLLMNAVPGRELKHLPDLYVIYLSIGLTFVSYVGASALAFAFLAFKAKKRGASLRAELGLTTGSALANIGCGALGWGAALVLVLTISLTGQWAFHSLPAPENPALPMLSFAPNTICRLALYSMAAIAAPFFEETFFRGVLLNALLLRFKPFQACLLTGLLFGGIHPVGITDALALAALGAVFAGMAYTRKSLLPGMFAHFLQNSYAYMAVYLSFAMIAKF